MLRFLFGFGMLAALSLGTTWAEEPATLSPRQALQPFNVMVGSWRGSGAPEGTREEKQKGHWTETIQAEWKFKSEDVWIALQFEKGKYFETGELRYRPKSKNFELQLTTTDKAKVLFTGTLKDKQLQLERTEDTTKETQRLVFSLLHHNRFLYRWEVKPADKQFFTKVYQVGATKEGVPFAETGDDERECVVSGGRGTSTVSYMGKSYWVCCSGCRDEFKESPEKYIQEFEKKKAEKKKK